MFRYIFRDGTEVLTPKGLSLQTIDEEEAKHGELEKIREVKDGNELRTGVHGTA